MNGSTPERVVITDLRIPFFRLVLFFVKCTLAAIPAAIILAVFAAVLTALAMVLGSSVSFFIMPRWTL